MTPGSPVAKVQLAPAQWPLSNRMTRHLPPEHPHSPLVPIRSQQTERHATDMSRAVRLREGIGDSSVQVVLG